MNIESMLEVSAPVSAVPDECRGMQLFMEAKAAKSSEGSSFKFGSAVKGAGLGGGESAYSQRGDGKFSDGSSFLRDGNTIRLGPDALSGPNAEETLKVLDQMSNMPDDRQAKLKASAPQQRKQTPAWLVNSKGDMFDLD